MTYVCDGKFSGNILVVGRTGCGKTAFVQKLAANKFFGDITKAEWVSFIKLDKQIEAVVSKLVSILNLTFIIQEIKSSLKSF